MIKKVKYLIFFLIFILFASCSFDNKSGIWSGSEKVKKKVSKLEKEQRRVIDVVKVYTSETFFSKEIPAVKSVNLTKPKTNSFWKMSGLNLQNFVGNIYLSGIDNNFLKKKIGKNKFSISQVMASPLVFNDNIIFADDTGTIFSINQRGKINWKKNIYKKIYKKIYKHLSFSIYKDKIYIADNIGFIYAISSENGKLIWLKNYEIPLKSNIKIFDNKIFVINQDNRLLCLDIEKGSKIWDVRSISSFIKSQNFLALAISKEGDLITLNSSGDLLKVKANNGQVYWSLNTTSPTAALDNVFFKSSEIVISDNDIIFSASSLIFSINLSNGYLNWQMDIGSKNTPIIDGNNIFLISDNGYYVNLDRNSGKIIWSTNILKILKKKKQMTQITGFIMGSGKIYATTLNGYLIVCSAVSGNIEYFKKIGDQIIAAPIINDGSLYVLTENSRILGFN
jgi:outer membrane protein assembly factor BamB